MTDTLAGLRKGYRLDFFYFMIGRHQRLVFVLEGSITDTPGTIPFVLANTAKYMSELYMVQLDPLLCESHCIGIHHVHLLDVLLSIEEWMKGE